MMTPGIRGLLRLVAERVGCAVDTAGDGHEALQKMQAYRELANASQSERAA
jgi:CheY-like chemotaxis protein